MKKICKFIVFVLISNSTFAQSANCGIYKTWQDYNNNNVSSDYRGDTRKAKLKLNHFPSKNYVEMILNGKKIRYYKDSIFGYRDGKHRDYRFFNNKDKEFQIIENKAIVIYMNQDLMTNSSGKNVRLVPAYYFSQTLEGAIFPLTILNLKKVFSNNLKFHDMLDVAFSDGTPITLYDKQKNMYKINTLFIQSQKN